MLNILDLNNFSFNLICTQVIEIQNIIDISCLPVVTCPVRQDK